MPWWRLPLLLGVGQRGRLNLRGVNKVWEGVGKCDIEVVSVGEHHQVPRWGLPLLLGVGQPGGRLNL